MGDPADTAGNDLQQQLTSARRRAEEAEAKRDRLQQQIAAERRWMQASMDTASRAILIVGPEGRLRAANRALEVDTGIPYRSLIGQEFDTIIEQIAPCFEDPRALKEAVARRKPGAEIEDLHLRIKTPKPRVISLWSSPVVEDEKSPLGVLWSWGDLTELEAAAAQLRALIGAAPVPLFITRQGDAEVLFANQQLAAMVGIPREQLVGQKADSFFAHDDDRDEVLARLDSDGSVHQHEARIRRSDGETMWGVFSLVRSELDGEAVTIGGIYSIDDRKRAEELADDALGKLEQARVNLSQTQSQLFHSEKMAALGSMMAGIAHEINTPVGAIVSMQDTLVRAVDKLKKALGTQFPEYAENRKLVGALSVIEDAYKVIEEGSGRVSQIVRRLRNFARVDAAELKKADLEEGIEDTLVLLHHQTKNCIELRREFGKIPEINCFPGQLNQVFLNILVNAIQAMNGCGTLSIATRAVGNEVEVRISDTGPGISPENMEEIFKPGFTTKSAGMGTGLGLSICFQIVQTHKGTISVDSEVGKGTTFTIRLPVDLKEPAQ